MRFIIIIVQLLCFNLFSLRGLNCLFEDQVGLFDWRHQYVGKVKFIEYIRSGRSSSRIVVGTEENTVAAINGKNGHIGWRHILEHGDNGRISDMKLVDSYLITVLAGGTNVRCFNAVSGSLYWEASIPVDDVNGHAAVEVVGTDQIVVLTHDRVSAFQLDSGADLWNVSLTDSTSVHYSHIIRSGDVLHVIGHTAESHVSLVSIQFDGSLLPVRLIAAPWITTLHKCVSVNGLLFVCADATQSALQVLPLTESASSFITVPLPHGANVDHSELKFFSTNSPALIASGSASVVALRVNKADSAFLVVDSDGVVKLSKFLSGVSAVDLVNLAEQWLVLCVSRVPETNVVGVKGYDLTDGEVLDDLSRIFGFPSHHGQPHQILGSLNRNKDGSTGFSLLILSEDNSIVLTEQPSALYPGKVTWSREEALASILSVEMVDLPVSQIMAKMEDEFGTHRGNILGMFTTRLTTQLSQLMTFLIQLKQKLRSPRHSFQDQSRDLFDENDGREFQEISDGFDEDYLTRDDFNLHKIIVVVTSPGKIYGLDSSTGRIVWQSLLPNVEPFEREERSQSDSRYKHLSMPLFVQRTTAHFPHQPVCTLLCRVKKTGQALIYSFHPVTGLPVEGTPSKGKVLNYNVLNAVVLTQFDEDFIRPLLLLDSDQQYHVYPASDIQLVRDAASTLFTFISDVKTGILTGYQLKTIGEQLVAQPLWTLDTNRQIQRITNVVSKRALEHVHSQGIVLEDRSVLYKYLNPNLVGVIAEGEDHQQKSFLSVYLVDAVTGNLVFHCTHKKAKGPVNIVQSENWLVYNFWNQKQRRVELAVLEMYEGNRQSNSTAFSSFHPPPTPIVIRQAYIFPGHVSAIATTITEKGITSKELLFALETGGILGLPKVLVDPRRPEVMSAEAREEGLIPYMPELPRPFDRFINYNLSVFNIRGIHTSPAGLESTSLVLCYGLDVFYTRVMPSKMFDVLKEDFDYFFISSVLVGMIAVSVISQKLAARKTLSRMWK